MAGKDSLCQGPQRQEILNLQIPRNEALQASSLAVFRLMKTLEVQHVGLVTEAKHFSVVHLEFQPFIDALYLRKRKHFLHHV